MPKERLLCHEKTWKKHIYVGLMRDLGFASTTIGGTPSSLTPSLAAAPSTSPPSPGRLHHRHHHLLEPRLYWQFWHKQIISNNIIPKMVKTKNWQTSALKMRADVSNCDKWPRRGQMGRRPFMWLTPGKSLEEVRNLGKDSAMEMCLVEELQRHPVMNTWLNVSEAHSLNYEILTTPLRGCNQRSLLPRNGT